MGEAKQGKEGGGEGLQGTAMLVREAGWRHCMVGKDG